MICVKKSRLSGPRSLPRGISTRLGEELQSCSAYSMFSAGDSIGLVRAASEHDHIVDCRERILLARVTGARNTTPVIAASQI